MVVSDFGLRLLAITVVFGSDPDQPRSACSECSVDTTWCPQHNMCQPCVAWRIPPIMAAVNLLWGAVWRRSSL